MMFNIPTGETPEQKKARELEDQRTETQKMASLLATGMERPQTPMQKLMDEHGTGEALLRLLGTGLSGGLLGPVLTPEIGLAGQQQYASDLELYNNYREKSLVTPAQAAYAQALASGDASPADLAGLAVLSGGSGEYDPNPKTYAPGTIGYFGNGQVAGVGMPQKGPNPTAPMQNAAEVAAGYGIPQGSRAYSDLLSAFAEPSGSQTLADGTVITFNTVDRVISDWTSGKYDEQPAGGQQGEGQTSQARPDGGVNQQQAQAATVRQTMNAEIADNLKIAPQKIDFYNELEEVLMTLGTWDEANDRFVANDDIKGNYGKFDTAWYNPASYEPFKGQGELDALTMVEQLTNMLTVDERGKLKGQGQITEGETEMLKRAVTALRDRNLGDDKVEAELERLYRKIQKQRAKFMQLQTEWGPDGQGGGGSDFDTLWNGTQ